LKVAIKALLSLSIEPIKIPKADATALMSNVPNKA
jgi:hypothetical protein